MGEVADRYDNLRIPITASERVPGSTPYYGANGIQDYVEGFTHQGEFVLIAEDGASDLDNYPTMCINGIIWVNNHAHVIQGRKDITDNHFIAWSIKRCDIKPMLTGGTRAKLNAEVLMGMRISTPNHAEQISIGSFFEHLDSLITLHQRKCEYRSLCGYLSWEQRKLGDVATIVGGGTPSTNNDAYWDGEIDWYSPAELGERVYADRSVRRITQAGYDSCSATLLPAGKTILFTSRAGIGNTAILRRSACTNQGFQSLVVNDDIDVYFVYSMTDRIKKFAEQKASGSTFLEISGKGLAAGEFAFPSKDEQTAIGSMFKQLDNLITLHQ
ncbi:restriction endonuclease subunit S [Eggerthella lenta]|nr:restriction endonuclease subunit S [Eggerthella lenta]